MTEAIDRYFQAEQAESLLFVAIGLVAVAASLFFLLRYGDAMSKGLAIPLIAVGLIQIVVGGSVYLRTPQQLSALKIQQTNAGAKFKAVETARMATVMTNFKIYKIIEVGFIVVGLTMVLMIEQPYWLGVGMGMLVQGALMLPTDITAEQRGAVYQHAVARSV